MIKRKFLTLAVTASLVGGFEGYRNIAYLDPVGIPTICFGATRNLDGSRVRLGQQYNYEECENLLYADLFYHRNIVLRSVKVPLSESQKIALTSFVYNVGEGAFQSSTLLRKINAGTPVGQACKEELPRWDKGTIAGRKIVLGGLVKRRASEVEICNTPDDDLFTKELQNVG